MINKIAILEALIKDKENKKLSSTSNSDTTEYTEPELKKDSLDQLKNEHLRNKNKEDIADQQKDRELKEKYARWLYRLLASEIAIIFIIVLLDGFSLWCFKINEWLLGVIFNSIIVQSFFLVRLVTEYLFKKK
ncbi:hypothetical protein ACOTWH_09125 [Aliarcobacter butzleri]